MVLETWEYAHMMALGVLNTMVPRLWLYLRYWWNEVHFCVRQDNIWQTIPYVIRGDCFMLTIWCKTWGNFIVLMRMIDCCIEFHVVLAKIDKKQRWFYSINVLDIVTRLISLYAVYSMQRNNRNFTCLEWLSPKLAYLSITYIFGVKLHCLWISELCYIWYYQAGC